MFLAFEYDLFSPLHRATTKSCCVYQHCEKKITHAYTIFEDSPSFLSNLEISSFARKNLVSAFLLQKKKEKILFLRKRPIIRNESKEGVDAGTLQHGYLITPATNKDRTTITKRDTNRKKKINEGKNRISTELNVKMRFYYDVFFFWSPLAFSLARFLT